MNYIFETLKKASPGKRLTYLRQSIGMNRPEFCKKHGININTMIAWERDQNRISKKGLSQLIAAFNKEGILCNGQWLTDGIDPPPSTIESFVTQSAPTGPSCHESVEISNSNINNEAYLFSSNNPSARLFKATDDGAEPYIFNGDIIGAVPLKEDQYNSEITNVVVAVLSKEEQPLIRKLIRGSEPDLFSLCSTNTKSKDCPPVLYNVDLKEMFRIVWIRKKL